MHKEDKKIGELMVEDGHISEAQRNAVLYEQRSSYELFGELAVKMNFISEDTLCSVLKEIYDLPVVDLDFVRVDNQFDDLLPYNVLSSLRVFPFYAEKHIAKIAIADPGNVCVLDEVCRYLKSYNVQWFITSRQKIERAIELARSDDQSNPITFLNGIIFLAIEKAASDLHFEPSENDVRVRARINGILYDIKHVSKNIWPKVKSRLKIISNLNIAESRRPQSGHARINVGGKDIDLRVSTHPNIFGESVAIRILDANTGLKKLSDLKFKEHEATFLRKSIKNPHGIFLIVGPTGSGKTTTLYSLLQELNTNQLNIMTLEDPIEYQIDGIRQLDLRDEGIISFSDGIRSILRQDPDVILVGEVRDEHTASAILRASLTGRLVLATLHSATPSEAIKRLANLGVDMKELSSQLIGIFSQRLLREVTENGYGERFPVTEYIKVTDDIKKRIYDFNSTIVPTHSFKQSIEQALSEWKTNIEEVQRVLGNAYI